MKTLKQILGFGFLPLALGLSGCASSPTLSDIPPKPNIVTPDGFGPQTFSCSDSMREEAFDITPRWSQGANIVFIIDDSNSMYSDFQRITVELGEFINKVNLNTNGNYRIAFIYDHINGDAFWEPGIPACNLPLSRVREDQRTVRPDRHAFYDQAGKLISNANPLNEFINNKNVFYLQERTWSRFADAAFFKAFAQPDFTLDALSSEYIASYEDLPFDPTKPWRPPAYYTAIQQAHYQDCRQPGDYFRPRHFSKVVSNCGDNYAVAGCLKAKASAPKIEDVFQKNVDLNIVTITNDDTDLNFNTQNYDLNDLSDTRLPETQMKMYQNIIRPLGSDVKFIYHSIVIPPQGRYDPNSEAVGWTHLSLAKKTGGMVKNFRDGNYKSLFNRLAEKVIFSDQNIGLGCSNQSDHPAEVKLEGRQLGVNEFKIEDGKLIIKASAFAAEQKEKSLRVEIKY